VSYGPVGGSAAKMGRFWLYSGRVIQCAFTNKWEPRRRNLTVATSEKFNVEGDVMRKILTALVAAATIGVAALAASAPAQAWRGGGWGWGWGLGGFAAGAIVGSALAAPYYYPPYAYGPYPYAPPPCVWRSVWNGYYWVRACV
jgi:hypothetical protein